MAEYKEHSLNGIGYRTIGGGTRTIILLRGLARWSEHWLGFDETLAGLGYKVVTIDNRGFGRSSLADVKNLNVALLAEDVAGIITKEAPAGAHVVGVSLGGMIAIALAAHKPQLVRSLMVINSSVSSSNYSRLTSKAIIPMLSVLMKLKRGHERLASVLLGPETSQEKKQYFSERWQKIDFAADIKLANLLAQLRAARQFDGRGEMAAIRCPVCVIKGAKDIFVDPQNSDFIHKSIRHSELEIHPLAGHEIIFDDPDFVSKKIRAQVEACQ